MSNTFINNSVALATIASVLTTKDLRVASMVNQEFSDEFGASKGATLKVRVPASLTASTRTVGATTTFVNADITEATQDVALTDEVYTRTIVSDADLTLSIEDASAQVIHPATVAIASKLEAMVVAKLQTLTADVTLSAIDFTDKAAVLDGLVDMRAALRNLGAPETGLRVAMAVDAYSAAIKAIGGASFQQTGANAADGFITRWGGMTLVESNRLASSEVVAFHRDAVALAVKAPATPIGAPGASVRDPQGLPLRIVYAFDSTNGTNVVLQGTFAGVGFLKAQVQGDAQRQWTVRAVGA